MKDWRADIKEHDSLYDLDPLEIMVFLRHQYLETAKDLFRPDRSPSDQEFGLECCEIAEAIELAIEMQQDVVNLEPSI